jgi:hypothetical protein
MHNFSYVEQSLGIRFGLVDEVKILEKYKSKILKELSKKWVDNHGWDGDDIYYKYKPTKSKEYIKEFDAVCTNKNYVLQLMFFYFFEYTKTINLKEEGLHVLQTVYHGRDQLFVDICKYIKKYSKVDLWIDQLIDCLEQTKKSGYLVSEKKTIYYYPLETELVATLEITRNQLLETKN